MCSSNSGAKSQLRLAKKQFAFQQEQVAKAEAREAERKANIERGLGSISDQFSKFDDPYYKNISDTYFNTFAAPQIAKAQAKDEQQTKFALHRQGIGESSAAAQEFGELAGSYADARVQARSRGQQLANNRRDDIEQMRSSLANQLYASEDPNVALQSAQRAVSGFQNASVMEPISDILANAAQFARRDYLNNLYQTGQPGLFTRFYNSGGSSGGTGKIIS